MTSPKIDLILPFALPLKADSTLDNCVFDSNGRIIAQADGKQRDYIIHAVNSHEALVAALQAIVECADAGGFDDLATGVFSESELCKRVSAALAAAKGTS